MSQIVQAAEIGRVLQGFSTLFWTQGWPTGGWAAGPRHAAAGVSNYTVLGAFICSDGAAAALSSIKSSMKEP